jgi:Carboxypeptidase regulatory-like domain
MIPLFFALLLIQDKAVIEGTVVNAVTNEPLRKAHVVLRQGMASFVVTSGSDGTFRFEGMEAGKYVARAERQGFLDNDEWVQVAAGERVQDVVITLTPEGVIAGHVVDEDGDPVAEATVQVERSIQMNGHRVGWLGSDQANTNSEGFFIIAGLAAGRYRISATPKQDHRPLRRLPNAGPREDFVRTEDPLPLQLAPGGALRNVEIKLRKAPVFRVRGRLSNAPDDHFTLYLSSESGGYSAKLHEGAFAFESVAAGSYTLATSPFWVSPTDNKLSQSTLFGRMQVTVSDRDVDGVVLALAPGPDISGTIRMEGDGHFEKPPRLWITGYMPLNQNVDAKEEGTFGWTNLTPQAHVVSYNPPDGYYVKSVQFNNQPVTNWVIDLRSGGGGTLDIVVAPNAATISAAVPDGKNTTVALWSDTTFASESTEGSSVVKFTALAPGEYRIAAWQDVEGPYLSILEFRARFDAKKITLTEGSHEAVELKLIPKSVSDAEAAKLP